MSLTTGRLYVVPEHRGRGVAKVLVETCERQAARLEIRRLYCYASTAEGLYTRLGWAVIGRDFYEGENVAVMQKDLAPA